MSNDVRCGACDVEYDERREHECSAQQVAEFLGSRIDELEMQVESLQERLVRLEDKEAKRDEGFADVLKRERE